MSKIIQIPDKLSTIYNYDANLRELVSKSKDFETKVNLDTGAYNLHRWDKEAGFSLKLVGDIADKMAFNKTQDNRITLSNRYADLVLYDIDGFADGAKYEYELLLKEKPPSNIIQFELNKSNVDFYKQPLLTAEDIAFGLVSPDWIQGGYCVYHSNKRDNKYKVGKLCDIPKPYFHKENDYSIGTFCDIDVSGNLLTITIPSDWYMNMTYPAVLDPTFGYTSIGTSTAPASYLQGMPRTMTEDGTADDINIYPAESQSRELGIYNDNSNYPGNLIDDTGGAVALTANQWNQKTLVTGASLSNGSQYWLSYINLQCKADSGGTNKYKANSDSTLPDPYPTGAGSWTWNFSLYINYTATGAPSYNAIFFGANF